ncbi:ribosome-associated translation inhibitor RaiA [Nitrospira defluvii]|nr:ribosome-associated translation inhibitor RaiA [Nitrospira defluvii]
MEVMITGKQLEITPALKEYVENRAEKIKKYTSKVTQVNFTLKVEKYRHLAEVLVKVKGFILQAEQETDEMYVSVDKAMNKIERQLKKHKEKLCDHRPHNGANIEELALMSKKSQSNIKKRKQFAVEPMTLEEAELQMELLGKSFFVFGNNQNRNLNVLYRRNDGTLGLIEPIY